MYRIENYEQKLAAVSWYEWTEKCIACRILTINRLEANGSGWKRVWHGEFCVELGCSVMVVAGRKHV
jgi:hypothetical protein